MPNFYNFLIRQDVGAGAARLMTDATAIAIMAVVAILVNLLFTRVILRAVGVIALRTETRIDEALVDKRAFARLSHIAPAFAIYVLAPIVLSESPTLMHVARVSVNGYVVVIGYLVLDAVINAGLFLYEGRDGSTKVALRTLGQATKLIGAILTFVFVLAAIFDRNPLYFFSGLGALTAVVLLVFKDTILGLVAGIQLSINDMIRVGDWIEMPSRGADGDVIDVSLTAVKIENWDKTVTTVPTWALVTESFRNWRHMAEAGGRRIKRALHLDQHSVHFLIEDELGDLGRLSLLRPYLEQRSAEIAAWNKETNIEHPSLGEGRQMTNLGTFRAYCLAWLRAHPMVHKEMTLIVRQLAPGPTGIPIEIYAFSNDTRWEAFESLQSDIFDHLIAIAPRFGLQIYQFPTSGVMVGEPLHRHVDV